MKRLSQSPFDAHFEELLRKNPRLAEEYAKQFAQLPLATQLAIMRRRRWLSQKELARSLRVKQPHVARVENENHDPRLSSIQNQARALRCHILVVPDELLSKVAQLVASGRQAR